MPHVIAALIHLSRVEERFQQLGLQKEPQDGKLRSYHSNLDIYLNNFFLFITLYSETFTCLKIKYDNNKEEINIDLNQTKTTYFLKS